MSNIDNCWYREVCNNECSSGCIRYLEMSSLLEKSLLPYSRWFPVRLVPSECDYNAFCDLAGIKNTIGTFVNTGSNLYLYSDKTGNGKTTWAIKLLLKYFDTIWAGNGFRPRGLFIHVPTFINRLKNFNSNDTELEDIKYLLYKVDLVVWDDIASTNLSNYDHSQLISFIDQRILDGKSNIYTSNLNQDGLVKALGSRIASRVWNSSVRVELVGGDRRDGSTSNIK